MKKALSDAKRLIIGKFWGIPEEGLERGCMFSAITNYKNFLFLKLRLFSGWIVTRSNEYS